MSEVIDYYGYIRNFKAEEKEELKELVLTFQRDIEIFDLDPKTLEFSVDGGWRGGGLSCEEIVAEHFGEYCEKHPYIEIEIIATYIEHAPSQTIMVSGDKTKVTDNF